MAVMATRSRPILRRSCVLRSSGRPPMSEIVKHSRRAALGALASVPALALPAIAVAESIDPIFAAIERHREAFAAFVAAVNAVDEVKAEQEGRKVNQADQDAYSAASDAEDAALNEFVTTIPLTIAGIHAAIAHVVKYDNGCIPEAET